MRVQERLNQEALAIKDTIARGEPIHQHHIQTAGTLITALVQLVLTALRVLLLLRNAPLELLETQQGPHLLLSVLTVNQDGTVEGMGISFLLPPVTGVSSVARAQEQMSLSHPAVSVRSIITVLKVQLNRYSVIQVMHFLCHTHLQYNCKIIILIRTQSLLYNQFSFISIYNLCY